MPYIEKEYSPDYGYNDYYDDRPVVSTPAGYVYYVCRLPKEDFMKAVTAAKAWNLRFKPRIKILKFGFLRPRGKWEQDDTCCGFGTIGERAHNLQYFWDELKILREHKPLVMKRNVIKHAVVVLKRIPK